MNEELDYLDKLSPEFIEMAYDYSRMERVTRPDGYGKRTGDCGDTVEMFLTVSDEGIVEHVSLAIEGCINTTACANTVGMMSEGKPVEESWNITPEKVADYLKTLEADHFHCAELACGAFYLALSNYREMKENSWKKKYQDRKLSKNSLP